MQLVFDVPTAAAALDNEPTLVMFAPHEGGQFRDWDDERLIRDGPRVADFASGGSHAGRCELRGGQRSDAPITMKAARRGPLSSCVVERTTRFELATLTLAR
jgi:hypothetical protein